MADRKDNINEQQAEQQAEQKLREEIREEMKNAEPDACGGALFSERRPPR